MVVLMSQGNSEGTRRCDARCYNAEGGECDCVCGGVNHGKGYAAAAENTAQFAIEKLKEYEASGCKSAGEILKSIGVKEFQLGF